VIYILAKESHDITNPNENGNADLENQQAFESVIHINESELKTRDSRKRRQSEDRGD
jgi:hypothetical protein